MAYQLVSEDMALNYLPTIIQLGKNNEIIHATSMDSDWYMEIYWNNKHMQIVSFVTNCNVR